MGGREMRDGMYSEWNTTVSEEPFWLLEAVLCLNWSEMLDSGEWLEKGNGWPRAEKEAFLELLFDSLKRFRTADGKESPSDQARFLAKELSEKRGEKLKCGFIGRDEDYLMRDAQAKLEEYALLLDREHITAQDAAFERLKERFDEENGEFDRLSERTLGLLEHAFDLLEAAFGAGQEMTIFVTELNTNYYSVHFLKENICERYYQYNKRLLFDDEEQRLRAGSGG